MPEYPCLGTVDEAEIWCNAEPGLEATVNVVGAYVLILYAAGAVVYFCVGGGGWSSPPFAYAFVAVCGLCVWAHLKTMLTDPGAVPRDALPVGGGGEGEGYCVKCDRFKPARAYHCSKCKRCVSRMDHHCPYTNNCVGAKNQKHMILFLIYCVALAVAAVVVVLINFAALFGAGALDGALAGALLADGLLTLAFTGAMLRRQVLSLTTGIGTIDRLKLAKGKPIAGGAPVPLEAVFGETRCLWPLPFDPDLSPEHEADVLGFRHRGGDGGFPDVATPLVGGDGRRDPP